MKRSPRRTGGQYGKCTEYVRHTTQRNRTITEQTELSSTYVTQNSRRLPFGHNPHLPVSYDKKYTEHKRVKQSTKMLILQSQIACPKRCRTYKTFRRDHISDRMSNVQNAKVLSYIGRNTERTECPEDVVYPTTYRSYRIVR